MNNLHDSPLLDTVLQALANQKRRAIIHDLSFHPDTIGHLARQHGLSLPAIHKHIHILEDAELIIRKKAGRTNFLALNASTLDVLRTWVTQYNTNWGSVEATLENYISRMQE